MPPKPSSHSETTTPAIQSPESATPTTPTQEWAEEMNEEVSNIAVRDAEKEAKKSADTTNKIQTTDGAEEKPDPVHSPLKTPSFLTRLRLSASSNTPSETPVTPNPPEDRHHVIKPRKNTRGTMLDVRINNADYHALGSPDPSRTAQHKCKVAEKAMEEVGLLNERVTNLEAALRETRAYWGKQFDAGFEKSTKDLNNLETNAKGSVVKLGQRVSALEGSVKRGPLEMESRVVKTENLVRQYHENRKSLEELSKHTTTELKKLDQACKEHEAVQKEHNKKISGVVERSTDMFSRIFRRLKDLEEKLDGS
ncbi:hypothetical protein KCU92_g1058, partial [Aureobasidium melanogenum]